MAETRLDDARGEIAAELDAALAVMTPQREGLQDFNSLNIQPETRIEVSAAIEVYDRRLGLIRAVLEALKTIEVLIADGYPNLDIREVEQAVYADLAENRSTIDAALATFSALTATQLGFTAGAPREKTPEEAKASKRKTT